MTLFQIHFLTIRVVLCLKLKFFFSNSAFYFRLYIIKRFFENFCIYLHLIAVTFSFYLSRSPFSSSFSSFYLVNKIFTILDTVIRKTISYFFIYFFRLCSFSQDSLFLRIQIRLSFLSQIFCFLLLPNKVVRYVQLLKNSIFLSMTEVFNVISIFLLLNTRAGKIIRLQLLKKQLLVFMYLDSFRL